MHLLLYLLNSNQSKAVEELTLHWRLVYYMVPKVKKISIYYYTSAKYIINVLHRLSNDKLGLESLLLSKLKGK